MRHTLFVKAALISLCCAPTFAAVIFAQTTQTSTADAAPLDTAALRPGDVIRLTVWPATEFSQDVTVDANGFATFRRLGELQTAGVPANKLREQLISGYSQYVRNPSIEVTFLRRVTVSGAVQKPGVYPVDPTMTLLDVVALAGGASAQGDPNHIELRRTSTQQIVRYDRTMLGTRVSLGSGDQIFVPERSFVGRNSGIVAAMITAAATLVIAFRR